MAKQSGRGDSMQTTVEEVTPTKARTWLDTSVGNRVLRKAHIATLAEAIKRGEYVLNGEPIIFDETGSLLDGHHRLEGVIASGKSIRSVVVRGVSRSSMPTLDQGVSRTVQDAFHIIGRPESALCVSAYRSLLAWLRGRGFGGKNATKMTVSIAQEMGKMFPEANEVCKFTFSHRTDLRSLGLAPSTFTAWLVLAQRVDVEMARQCAASLLSGAGLSENDPIFAARRLLLREKGAQIRRMDPFYHTKVLMKMFDMWMSGEKSALMKIGYGEAPRQPAGLPKEVRFGVRADEEDES